MAAKKTTPSTTKKKRTLFSRSGSSKKHPLWKNVLLWMVKLGFFFLFLMVILFGLVYIGAFGRLPDAETLIKIKEPVASEVFSQDGKLLGRYYVENRSNVNFKEISPNVINALIATEDSRFYEHRGIDEWAVLRVFFKSIILADRSSGGGSTLSQQIAKNIFGREKLGPLTLPVSKIRESIIAYRLEKLYSKEDILTLYLNTVPFGENTFGIETAAERFFSTSPAKLSVPQAATLVGILKANNAYNPRLNPERSLQRRNTVIRQMEKNDYLTKAEADKYCDQPLGLKYNYLVYNTGLAAYFREMVRPEMEKWCAANTKPDGTPYNLYTDGLRIVTTIDSRMQRYAETAMKEQMKQLQETFDQHWKGKNPWGSDNNVVVRAMKRSDRYQRMKKAGKVQKEIDQAFKTPVNMKLFAWDEVKQVKMTPLDSVKYSLKLLRSAFLAINPKNGAIKVWIGGNDFRFFQYDNVRSSRQVGSVFKPIVYTAALESGMQPDKYFANELITYHDYQDWTPQNADGKYGGFYSLEGALTKSVNTVSVQVLMESGISETVGLARKMGIEAELSEYPSLALGAANIPLYQLVKAYCCFANNGMTVKPYHLIRIEDGNGKVLEKFSRDSESNEAVSPENTRIINRFLQSVVDEGTGASIRTKFNITGDFAGKTGTTQNYADGWFIGYTPDIVTGSWVGADDPAIHFRSIAYGSGSYMALPIAGGFFRRLYSDPAFASWKEHTFPLPDEETLAMLDIPPFAETVKQRKQGSFWDIFKSDRPKTETKTETKKESEKPAHPANPPKEEKSNIWQKIKDALKKK